MFGARYEKFRYLVNFFFVPPFIQVLTKYLLPVVAVAIGTNIPRFLEMIHSGNIIQEEGMEGIETGNVFKVMLYSVLPRT